ncbi:MOSC domain-containing protein [soil metagenome]|jgi:MOSC domain-containing protein YiiM
MEKESGIKDLMNRFPNPGLVTWIGVRTKRGASVTVVNEVQVLPFGLENDHYKGKENSTRHVTLIQEEHIQAVASLLSKSAIDPGLLRRNIVVKGINLLALKDKIFTIGEAKLEMTGLCHPCSRMEKNLGEGGYNAMRGHSGITAKVVQSGKIRVGDRVQVNKV